MTDEQIESMINEELNQRNDIPDKLKALVQQIEDEKYMYPRRDFDMSDLENLLEGGYFDEAESRAKHTIKAQSNLHKGVPEELTRLVQKARKGVIISYPARNGTVEWMEDSLANGYYEEVERAAKHLIEMRSIRWLLHRLWWNISD